MSVTELRYWGCDHCGRTYPTREAAEACADVCTKSVSWSIQDTADDYGKSDDCND